MKTVQYVNSLSRGGGSVITCIKYKVSGNNYSCCSFLGIFSRKEYLWMAHQHLPHSSHNQYLSAVYDYSKQIYHSWRFA